MLNVKSYVACLTALLMTTLSPAATLQHQSGGLEGLTVVDGSDQGGHFFYEDNDNQATWLSIFAEIAGPYTNARAGADASFSSFQQCGEWMSDLHINTSASCSNPAGAAVVTCDGNIETQDGSGNSGYFLQVAATEPGELPGDQVTVSFAWNPYITITGAGCTALVQGPGGASEFGIAVNPAQPVSGLPPSGEMVWTHPNVSTTVDYMNSQQGSFTAHVGDIIGIYVMVASNIEYVNAGDFQYLNTNSPFTFSVDIENNPADINHDGTVNMLDFAIMANEWLWVRPGRIVP